MGVVDLPVVGLRAGGQAAVESAGRYAAACRARLSTASNGVGAAGAGPRSAGEPGRDTDQAVTQGAGSGPGVDRTAERAEGVGEVVGHGRAGQPGCVRGELRRGHVGERGVLKSVMTCSTMAWSRWVASAASIGSALSLNTAWNRSSANNADCPGPASAG